ncbi:MAG: GGDEF domain-containing protein [Epsilonproteobacteria bacterium]|nr:GGDEF domain-containing protein [Campylobacterota bacterium]
MQKDKLISIANKMCKELSIIIEDKNATKEQVVSYLQESAQIILNTNIQTLDNINFTQSTFENAYKEIAEKSLSSYTNTNENIKKLTQVQEITLQEYGTKHTDLPTLTEKFDEIKKHMTDEVTKANEIITELINQVKNLEKKSNLDSLTKVYNRRAMSSYLNNICSNNNNLYNFHLLMLDIDDFKKINDMYGHIVGDKVLIFVGNILKKTLRDGDKVFRYGGEEFIIVLNRTDTKNCDKIANRLLSLIRDNQLIYKDEGLSVTISIGMTEYIQGDTPDSIIERADKALYKAKNNGKDQIYMEVR